MRFMGDDDETYLAIGDNLVTLLERHTGLRPDSTVLDIGCGYGRLAHALLRRGFTGRYLGVDVLERHIRWCAEQLGTQGVEFRHVDAHNDRYNPNGTERPDQLDLEGETFEIAALFSVFTHMWPEDVAAYMRVIASALDAGGAAVASFFLLDGEWWRLHSDGAARRKLPHRRTAFCRYESEAEPLLQVAYELDWVVETAHDAGLRPVLPPHFGTWSGRRHPPGSEPGRHDLLVFERLDG
jgi:SAM-dependent methyltransferase